ncbi:MAG: hypothetical protein D6683_15335 [Actinomyces sp.]|nr:MAG: hypothetical protein D6683_15335 [Actinomyces sp.]
MAPEAPITETESAETRTADAEAVFDCPRCGRRVRERFYGPCTSCRGELRATLGGSAREVEVAEYEPKMNVTPNAVALRDD